jgi:hypothetical protein
MARACRPATRDFQYDLIRLLHFRQNNLVTHVELTHALHHRLKKRTVSPHTTTRAPSHYLPVSQRALSFLHDATISRCAHLPIANPIFLLVVAYSPWLHRALVAAKELLPTIDL